MNHHSTNINDSNVEIQESFLNNLRDNETLVSIYLLSGIKLNGYIESYDHGAITLNGRTRQMIHRHAIASISASKQLDEDTTQYNID